MTLTDIAQQRFINQQLAGSSFTDAGDLVTWFAAIQAQEYAQTKWGLGLRLPHAIDSDIEQLISEGKILRIHLLRPTWHFVAAKDIRWLLQLTAPRVNAVNGTMYKKLELDEKIFTRCTKIIVDQLKDGHHMTREALNEAFKKNKIEAQGHRLSYIMMQAELAGIICSGARHGNQFTYALLEERVEKAKGFTAEEALAELTKRYFSSRGPATVKDFSTWSGLSLTECKKGIEINKSDLQKQVVEGTEYYFNETKQRKHESQLFLLPLYDELIMGYKDRSPSFEGMKNLKTPASLPYDCMIAFEGQIIGTWKRMLKPKSMDIALHFFRALTKDQKKALDAAVHRLEKFGNVPVNVVK